MLDQLPSHSLHCSRVSPCEAAAAAVSVHCDAAAAASAIASVVINTCCTSWSTSRKELSELVGVAPGRNRGRPVESAPLEWLRRRGLTSLGLCAPKC